MTTFFCIWRETSDHSWIAAAASGLSLRVHRLHRFWKDLAESVGTGKVVVVFIHVQPNHLTRPSQTPKSETATTQVTKAKGCPKTSPIIAANQKAPQSRVHLGNGMQWLYKLAFLKLCLSCGFPQNLAFTCGKPAFNALCCHRVC